MLRVILLACVLALLGLGTAAYAGCQTCFTSVVAVRSSTDIRLSFSAQTQSDLALPSTINAVLMQVDGNRTKCANLTLDKIADADGLAIYAGTFRAYGTYSHSGRVEFAGQIYEFTVPLDGTPGKIDVAADQSPIAGRGYPLNVSAAPVSIADRAAAPTAAPTTAPSPVQLPSINPTFAIGGALVLLTIIGAYFDRRRALRSAAG